MKLILCIAFVLIAAPASAQQQQQSSELEAMYARINAEVNTNLQCNVAAINLNRQLKEAQERVKTLEAKYEPADKPK